MECPVCFQVYSLSNHYAMKLSCNHIVCNDCVTIIKSSNFIVCPICRTKTEDLTSVMRCHTIDTMLRKILNQPEPVKEESKQVGLLIRTLKGNIMNFTMNISDSVLDLKEQIQNIEGIDVHSQLLLFEGKALGNHETLSDCGVYDACLIYLVFRSFGG